MEPKCSICTNQYRKPIDLAIASGTSVRKVATQYGITPAAVQRHKLKHLETKAKAVRTQQAVHHAKQAERAENEHMEKVQNVWETRLDDAYTRAINGHERLAGSDKWEAVSASYLGAAAKICDTGLRATGGIQTGTTVNIGRVLVMPTQGAEIPQELVPGSQRELPPAIDAECEDTEEDE